MNGSLIGTLTSSLIFVSSSCIEPRSISDDDFRLIYFNLATLAALAGHMIKKTDTDDKLVKPGVLYELANCNKVRLKNSILEILPLCTATEFLALSFDVIRVNMFINVWI